jgi:hypothetical protein
MTFAGAATWLLLHATPNTATEIIATASDNLRLRKGVIKQTFHMNLATLVSTDLK